MRLRKTEYVMAAILGISLTPLILNSAANIDLLKILMLVIPMIFFVLGLGFATGIWLNLIVYDKGIRDAEMFLSLIDEFCKEE